MHPQPLVVSQWAVVTRSDAVEAIRRDLAAMSNQQRAVHEKAYLKSERTHLGCSVPEVRRSVTTHTRGTDRTELLATVERLWGSPVYEENLAAALAISEHSVLLGCEDMPTLESMIRQCGTWALVDVLAPRPLAELDRKDPALITAELDRWVTDEDFWVRRAAILAHLVALRGQPTADWPRIWERFQRYADALTGDREFFVRKAMGWVLRETSRHHPREVAAWVAPRAQVLATVTFNEAIRRLPDVDRTRLRGLRAAGRA